MKIRELEDRNSAALQQLADMVDSIIGLGPIISKHLYEKGLSIPQPQSSRIRSQTSIRSDQSGRCERDSEYNLKLGMNSFFEMFIFIYILFIFFLFFFFIIVSISTVVQFVFKFCKKYKNKIQRTVRYSIRFSWQ